MPFDFASSQESSHFCLCAVKFLPRHNALMGVLYGDPIPTADPDGVRVAYHIPYPFAVNVFPKIALIPENLCDGAASPEVIFKKARPACPGTASRPLIQHGRWYSFTVQHHGDLLCVLAVCHQVENAPHCLCRIRVNHKTVFIVRVLDIAIGGERGKEVPTLGAEFLCAPHLSGEVPAVKVIKEGLEGGFQAVNIGGPDAVKAIVDGDKPHTQEGEHAGNVAANCKIITAKTG